MIKSKETAKLKWYLMLLLAILLFFTAMATGQLILNAVVIVLAIIIYKYGNPILFKEYDEKRKQKMEQSLAVREAAKDALNSGKLFRKK